MLAQVSETAAEYTSTFVSVCRVKCISEPFFAASFSGVSEFRKSID